MTLSVVSSFPREAGEHDGFWAFIDRSEQNAPWIRRSTIGRSGCDGPLQLVEALQSGAIDVATLPDAYFVHQAPQLMRESGVDMLSVFLANPFTAEREITNIGSSILARA